MKKKVLVFGSFVADLTGRGKKFPLPGETVLGTSFQSGPGGKGSNQAVAAHRAGADVQFVTKLGRDTFGRMAMDFYQQEGMDASHLMQDEAMSTGAALIMVNEQTGQNEIMVYLGACNHITPEDVESCRGLIASADILLLQMEINLDALEAIIRMAHDAGVQIVLNPAPAQRLSDDLMGMIDLVTPNETEAYLLTGVEIRCTEDASKAAKVFLNKGVRGVVITLGEKGVYVTDGRQEECMERIPVQAVDTTGAGDAFNGGLVKALAEGRNLFEAARYGNCTGALSVTRKGTAPAMPYAAQIDELFEKTYGC